MSAPAITLTRVFGLDALSLYKTEKYMMRIVPKNGWRTKEPGDVPGQMGETIF